MDEEGFVFFTPASMLPTDYHRELYPQGYTDLGLAHGVPGPLAALAIAQRSGIDRPGLREAICRLVSWVYDHRSDDKWGPNWPMGVGKDSTKDLNPTRPAWCYGTPGIATALWHAADALQDEELRLFSVRAMEGVATRSELSQNLPSPIICHGIAGVLQTLLRFLEREQSADLVRGSNELARRLVDQYDPHAPLGFRDFEGEQRIDSPSLLEGATGVALVMLSAASIDVEPAWDRMFLLA